MPKGTKFTLKPGEIAWIIEPNGAVRTLVPVGELPMDQVYALLALSKDLHDVAMTVVRAEGLDIDELPAVPS